MKVEKRKDGIRIPEENAVAVYVARDSVECVVDGVVTASFIRPWSKDSREMDKVVCERERVEGILVHGCKQTRHARFDNHV